MVHLFLTDFSQVFYFPFQYFLLATNAKILEVQIENS